MVICLERGANDLHMVQLMPLPPDHLCFSKIQNGLSFWYRLTWVVLEKRQLNDCVYVCVRYVCVILFVIQMKRRNYADKNSFSSQQYLHVCDSDSDRTHSRVNKTVTWTMGSK